MARIAVIGSGAVGLFYGAQFVLAGHDVRFLLRRDFARIAADGIRIDTTATTEIASARDGSSIVLPPTSFRACRDVDACALGGRPEWILLAVKTTAIAEVLPMVAALADAGTAVAVLCNGLGVEERVATRLPPESVFGALAQVCLRRREDGTVHHQAQGKLLLGHLRDDPDRLARLSQLVGGAGIASEACGCLLEARWRKLVWNFPFNGLSVALDADTATILATPERCALVAELMAEIIAAANADLAAAGKTSRIDAASWILEMMRRTRAMGAYATSTLLDLRAGSALEVEALFAEPVRRALAAGIAAPRMTTLLEQVRERAGG
ncbi:MAG: 2-dehydropantoate 2-reductase [Planctomycetes bacterium]|nr:2-dehydropantoate 2-reductase [Planctomycetota bacterium]